MISMKMRRKIRKRISVIGGIWLRDSRKNSSLPFKTRRIKARSSRMKGKD